MTECGMCGQPVTAKDRRYSGPCTTCGTETCPACTNFYVDGQNRAISAAARPKCVNHKGTP